MLLTNLPKYLKCKQIQNFHKKNLSFNKIYTNSRDVKKNSIFVIKENLNFKRKYIEEAISNGAVAILHTKYLKNLKVNQYIVNNIDLSIKILLLKLYPNKPVKSIAITGTNGKTSVAWYISQICLINKIPSKLYGTLGYYINHIKKNDSKLTTPNYEVLHQTSFSRKRNIYNFIFEASSHALAQDRIKCMPIDIAAITNLTQDHLDYHKNFENYSKAKFSIFLKYLNHNGYAIINDNIKGVGALKKKINKNIKIISYGRKNSDINLELDKNNIIINIYKKKFIFKSANHNKIDLENFSCAIACCICLNINVENIIKALKKTNYPPGRLEKIQNKDNYNIYVDYAHTPDALKQILINKTFNNVKPNLLFGCGGDRDQDKRSEMGYISNKFANKVYITDDNPRNENPKNIRKKILEKCKKGIEIPNRKKAIFQAVSALKKNEVLILAGKGHEKFQIINNFSIKFDDVKIAKLALKNK